MQKRYGLYLNGLGDGTLNRLENAAIKADSKKGFTIKHVPINWRSDETLDELIAKVNREYMHAVKEHGDVVLIGASAGGSLAVNVLAKTSDPNMSVITICSRLNEVKLAWWDPRNLKRMAHIGTKNESMSFYDSVLRSTNESLPLLRTKHSQQLTVVTQRLDEVVPRRTMSVSGFKQITIRSIGHNCGIYKALEHISVITHKVK